MTAKVQQDALTRSPAEDRITGHEGEPAGRFSLFTGIDVRNNAPSELKEGDAKSLLRHPQMSFFETIDEQRAIVLARIAEVRIWKNYSLTWTHPNPLQPMSGDPASSGRDDSDAAAPSGRARFPDNCRFLPPFRAI